MAAGKEKEYSTFVENFKKQFDDMMGTSSKAMTDLFQSTKEQFDKMQASYAKGNKTMLESLNKNYEQIKAQLKENYDKAKGDNEGFFESNFTKFKDGCSSLYSSLTGTSQSVYDEATKALNEKKKAAEIERDKKYNDLVAEMDKNYQETVKRLSMTAEDVTSKAGLKK